ncbi:MAG: response regulator [Filomicrobium sp.]
MSEPVVATERMRVIAADDDPIIRQLYETRLTAMRCDVKIAEDGAVAWNLIRKAEHVDLALIDLEMPNVDGFALIQCIRSHPKTRHLPITVVTSRTDSFAIQQALQNGATSFLTKPLNWSTFQNHIEYLMHLTKSADQSRTRAQRAEASARIRELALSRTYDCGMANTEMMLDHLHRLAELTENSSVSEPVAQELIGLSDQIEGLRKLFQQSRSVTDTVDTNAPALDERVPLSRLLEGAKSKVAERSEDQQCGETIDRIPDNVSLSCEFDNLSLAVSHLIENAIRFSAEGEPAKIDAEVHQDGMLTITVTDDGIGMEPEFCTALLSPNSDQSLSSCSVGGVGLMLAKAIAESHGGSLEIRSMPNQGTSAMLVIPAERVSLGSENGKAA